MLYMPLDRPKPYKQSEQSQIYCNSSILVWLATIIGQQI